MSLPAASNSSTYANSSNSISIEANTKLKGNFVKEPLESDVLFGRGKQPLEHTGNKRMRRIVDKYTIMYHSQLKAGKKKIAQQVYDEVMHGGTTRFLKRVDEPHGWIVVDNVTAMNKIAHALRCRKNANRLISKSRDLAKRFRLLEETRIPQSSRFSNESNASNFDVGVPTSTISSRPQVDQQLFKGGASSLLSSDPTAVVGAQAFNASREMSSAHLERNLELTRYGLGILPNPSSILIGMRRSHLDDLLLRSEIKKLAVLQLMSNRNALNPLFPPF